MTWDHPRVAVPPHESGGRSTTSAQSRSVRRSFTARGYRHLPAVWSNLLRLTTWFWLVTSLVPITGWLDQSVSRAVQRTDAPGQANRTTEQAPNRVRLPAKQVVELRKRIGQEVTVVGLIERTSVSTSGHHFLDFADSELSAICFAEEVARFGEQKPAALYANQQVELTGTLSLYRGKLQIKLQSPTQIRLVKPIPDAKSRVPGDGVPAGGGTEGTQTAPAPVKLQRLGSETWLSPAGLRYAGRDPAGLTRVEHVARHFRDQPDRPGSHGVFDGGEGVAFAVIDEAWKRAERQNLKPQREGDRSSYTVPMGRRIGYLGGQAGKTRGFPELKSLFIVFETGTKNIITAFPK